MSENNVKTTEDLIMIKQALNDFIDGKLNEFIVSKKIKVKTNE